MKQSCTHDLRRSLPLSEWPEIDRTLWHAALRPADLLEDGGSRARHAPSSNSKVARGYGLWLDWLVRHDLFEPAVQPGSRITQARVSAYVETLRKSVSTGTIINRLEDLRAALRAMDSDSDGSWIRRMISKVQAQHAPAVRKRDRVVSATDLFDLGLDLMRRASSASTLLERSVIYRDGLMIGVLSTRPLRLRNLIGLELGRTFVWRGDTWWIDIPGGETKTHEAMEMPLPDELTTAVEAYLKDYRPFLCRRRGRWTVPTGNALWVSQDGSPLGDRSAYQQLVVRTRAAFGHPINPHLFRDCVATSIAIGDPEHVRITARLLGHRSLVTPERYYNQAHSVDAIRLHQELVIGIRDGTIEIGCSEEDDL